MISSESYESYESVSYEIRIKIQSINIEIIILLENEAPCVKKLFHFFLLFYTLYHEQTMPNMVLYTNNHDPN